MQNFDLVLIKNTDNSNGNAVKGAFRMNRGQLVIFTDICNIHTIIFIRSIETASFPRSKTELERF